MTLATATITHAGRKSFGNSEFVTTEVGRIPSDWTVKSLRQVCKLINGRGFKPYEWRSAGLPIIRIQNLNGSNEFNHFVGPYDRKLEVPTGQLLFAWSGSRGSSFGPHIWNGPLGLLNYHTWKVQTDAATVTQPFLLHKLRQLTAEIEGWAHGASALVHVQKWQMEGFKLAIPTSTREQSAIAEALSDADALIEGLESLVAKKRAIKQGAMQELLTGRCRLPGFKQEWIDSCIQDIATVGRGRVISHKEISRSSNPIYPVYSSQTSNDGIMGWMDTFMFEGEYITWTTDGANAGTVFYRSGRFNCTNVCGTIKLNDQSACHAFVARALGLVAKAHVSRHLGNPKLMNDVMKRITIRLPATSSEQSAIAAVLSDMDAELEALEGKLAKARAVKQGMMQELLTGRVRLV